MNHIEPSKKIAYQKDNRTHLQGSEMNNAVNIGVRSEDFVKCNFIGDIDIVVDWTSASQQFNAADDFLRRVVLVVDNDNLITGLDEGDSGERANIAGSTILESENLRPRE